MKDSLIHVEDKFGSLRAVKGSTEEGNIVSFAQIYGSDGTTDDIRVLTDSAGKLRVGGQANHGATANATPVGVSGEARVTNPTPVDDGDAARFMTDDVGRIVTSAYQVRDLVQTASASLTNGTETQLLAGAAGVFNDLVHVTASNNSGAAVTVDFRETTGNAATAFSMDIAANSVETISFSVPYPQGLALADWTADMPDITGTTVSITALFIKNV